MGQIILIGTKSKVHISVVLAGSVTWSHPVYIMFISSSGRSTFHCLGSRLNSTYLGSSLWCHMDLIGPGCPLFHPLSGETWYSQHSPADACLWHSLPGSCSCSHIQQCTQQSPRHTLCSPQYDRSAGCQHQRRRQQLPAGTQWPSWPQNKMLLWPCWNFSR